MAGAQAGSAGVLYLLAVELALPPDHHLGQGDVAAGLEQPLQVQLARIHAHLAVRICQPAIEYLLLALVLHNEDPDSMPRAGLARVLVYPYLLRAGQVHG